MLPNEAANRGISADWIKFIAIVCMTVDHIAWAFVPRLTPLGQIMHVFGRVTAPVMCFFIAEGYHYTRSLRRYAGRLFVLALISEIPFSLFETGNLFSGTHSVMYTLLLGLLAVAAYDRIPDPALRLTVVAVLCFFAKEGDWGYWAVLFCLAFHASRGQFSRQALSITLLAALLQLYYVQLYIKAGYSLTEALGNTLMQLGVLLSLPLLSRYRERRAKATMAWGKWIFYLYYPAHLTALYIIKETLQYSGTR